MTSPTPDEAARSGTDSRRRGSVPFVLAVALALLLGAGAAYLITIAVVRDEWEHAQSGPPSDDPTDSDVLPGTTATPPGALPPTIDVTSAGTAGGNLVLTGTLDDGPIALGVPGTITISAHNTTAFPLAVSALGVLGVDSSDANCRAEWLHLGAVAIPKKDVLPGGTVRVRVPYELVDLPGVNQDACKGAQFRLTISGTGQHA